MPLSTRLALLVPLALVLLSPGIATAQEVAPEAPKGPSFIEKLFDFLQRAVTDGKEGFPAFGALAGEASADGVRELPLDADPFGKPLRLLPADADRGVRLELEISTAGDSAEDQAEINEFFDALRAHIIQHLHKREQTGDRLIGWTTRDLGRAGSEAYPMHWHGQVTIWQEELATGGLLAALLELDDTGQRLTLSVERIDRPTLQAPPDDVPLFDRAEALAERCPPATRVFDDEWDWRKPDERFYRQYEHTIVPDDLLGELIALIADDAPNGFTSLRAAPPHDRPAGGWKYPWTRPCGTGFGSDHLHAGGPHWPLRLVPAATAATACWNQIGIDPLDERACCLVWLTVTDTHAATIDAALGDGWQRTDDPDEGVVQWACVDGTGTGTRLLLDTEPTRLDPRFARIRGEAVALRCLAPDALATEYLQLRRIAALGVRNGPGTPVRIADYLNVAFEGVVWPNENRLLKPGRDVLIAIDDVELAPLTDDEILALLDGPTGGDVRLLIESRGTRREVIAGRGPVVAPGQLERILEGEDDSLSPRVAAAALDVRRFPACIRDLVAAAEDEFESVAGPAVGSMGVRRLLPNYLGNGETTRWQRLTGNEDYAQVELVFAQAGRTAFEKATRPYSMQDHSTRFVELQFGEWLEVLFPPDQWNIEAGEDIWRATRPEDPLLGPTVTFWHGEALLEIRVPRREHRERLVANPELARRHCIEGDCENGYGRYLDHERRAVHEGYFKDGRAHGPGRRIERNGRVFIGIWRNGFRHGPGVRVYPQGTVSYDRASRRNVLFANRILYEDGKYAGSVEVDLLYPWSAGEALKERFRDARDADGPGGSNIGYEFGPFLARKGEVLDGNTQQGRARVELPGIGTYEGRFVNGIAEGRGLLRRADGSLYLIDCVSGIPSLQRILIPPNDLLWEAYQQGVFLSHVGDSLTGDCWNGTGTMLMNWGGAYVGQFKNNEPHGQGELWDSRLGRGGKYVGNFTQGRKNGRFTVHPPMIDHGKGREPRYTSGGPPETHWYRDDQRVTESGEDYYAWRKRLREEAAAASRKPAPRSSSPITMVCSSCRGTGTYDHPGKLVDEWATGTFMPGSRHYGSWLWSGYTYRTGRQVRTGAYSGPCGSCGGDGIIRVDQPLGSSRR